MRSALPAFCALLLADFLVRTAYMAAKSPVLPVFAQGLGAGEVLLGLIVAVSSCSGMLLKPLFGALSDRQGQWVWLLIGTGLFAAVPVLYLAVETTQALVALRLGHGLATAIYGPVTLAFVAGLGRQPRAEWFGWFGLSRTAGYVLGPLIGAALLSVLPAAQVLAATSGIAVLAFAPVLVLRQQAPRPVAAQGDWRLHLAALAENRALLGFGLAELSSRVGIYAVKTFIPLVILSEGGSAMQAGLFLSIQEAAVAVTRPVAGRIADRKGAPGRVAMVGLAVMAVALAFIPQAGSFGQFALLALAIGVGNGVYHPAAMALIAGAARREAHGLSFGVVGALRNLGKVLGPVLGGVLLYALPVEGAFAVLGLITLCAGLPLARPVWRASRV